MPSDASNDWLEVAKTRAQGIRTALAGIGVFVACVLVTIFGQLRQFEADQKAEALTHCFVDASTSAPSQTSKVPSADCPIAADWGPFQAVYDEFPTQQIDDDLTSWNQFAIQSTIIGSLVEGTDPAKFAGQKDPEAKLVWLLAEASSKTPLKIGTTSEISHFYLHLQDFDSNLRSIKAAVDARTPFEALDRDKLIILAKAYAFNLDSGDIQGEYAAHGLANPTFISQLNRLRPSVLNAEGHPIMEDQFVEKLETGASLSLFTTLRQQLTLKDLGKFQRLDDAEIKKLLDYLTATRFASINAERDEDARLSERIEAVERGELTSPISLPFLNLSIDLSAFASLSGFLNLTLLGWIFWQARQMDDASNRYLTFPDADKSRVEAALQGLPGSGGWNVLSKSGFALLISTPTLLGTLLLFTPLWFLRFANAHWYSLFYLILPTVVFVFSLTLVTFIENSTRHPIDVPLKPPAGAPQSVP